MEALIVFPAIIALVWMLVYFSPMMKSTTQIEIIEAPQGGATKPFIVGYQDMAYSMYLDPGIPTNTSLTFGAVCRDGKVSLRDRNSMEFLAEHRGAIENFVPDNGRKDSEYMAGEDEQWDEYYAGGVAFMEDFMAFCKGEDEKSRLIESRRLGAKELDSRFSLRSEHEDFDKQMEALIAKEK